MISPEILYSDSQLKPASIHERTSTWPDINVSQVITPPLSSAIHGIISHVISTAHDTAPTSQVSISVDTSHVTIKTSCGISVGTICGSFCITIGASSVGTVTSCP